MKNYAKGFKRAMEKSGLDQAFGASLPQSHTRAGRCSAV
jgi:hypothetical protein